LRLGPAEAGVLALLAAWALAPLARVLIRAADGGLVPSGADEPFAADQFQYMSWIRDGGRHVLASNTLDIHQSAHVFLHPMFVLSGLAWRAGVPMQVAYLAWKPVAIALLFGGFLAYSRRLLPNRASAAAAALLALFFASPVAALMDWLTLGGSKLRLDAVTVAGETFPAGQVGYHPTGIAMGLMPVFLLMLERAIRDGGRRWTLLGCAAGALAAWLHPWQGEVLIVVAAGALVLCRSRTALHRSIAPLAATAAPLVYYFVLARADDAWHLAEVQNTVRHPSLLAVVLALSPLLIPAAVGLRRPDGFQEYALLLWPPAVLVVFLITPTFPAHAFEALALPLSILLVRALALRSLPRLAVVAVFALLIVPGAIWQAHATKDFLDAGDQPYNLTRDERDALSYIEHSGSGGVLASRYLGPLVPAYTGHQVWLGHPSWTRDYAARAGTVDALFGGALDPARARQAIAASRARTVLAVCRDPADLTAVLPPGSASERRFGCVRVYVLRGPQV
jgi:hypothetical protein